MSRTICVTTTSLLVYLVTACSPETSFPAPRTNTPVTTVVAAANLAQPTSVFTPLTEAYPPLQEALTPSGIAQSPMPTWTIEPNGIFDYDSTWAIPGSNTVVYIANIWHGAMKGREARVFSGAISSHSRQGVLYVLLPLESKQRPWYEGYYNTPTQSGIIRIVREENYRLQLLAADGAVFYFDIPGLRFTGSFDESVPTITPIIAVTSAIHEYP